MATINNRPCCGTERKGSLHAFTHQNDGCLKTCAPGTDLSTATSLNTGNLPTDAVQEIDIISERQCSNSVATLQLDLTIDLNLAGV